MSTIPTAQLVLGYKEYFKVDPPKDRISIIQKICRRNLIVEFSGLNYRLKPNTSKYHDTSLETQKKELQYFCGIDANLHKKYAIIADSYTPNKEDHPLIFIRQTCLFALEEIIQSDLPVIENFNMDRMEVWDSIFKYILAVNSAITAISAEPEGESVTLEAINPKMLPLNELNINLDPIYTPYRGYRLLEYLSNHELLKDKLVEYFKETYDVTFDYFVYETLGMSFNSTNRNPELRFYYNVPETSNKLFEQLSRIHKSTELSKLLSLKKYPFYKDKENSYILMDANFLLEKTYNQFINDFWFGVVKDSRMIDGSEFMNIRKYRSIIGYFFETYITEIVKYSFEKAKYYVIKLFEELKINKNTGDIEIADLYVRFNSKIILGQVKSTNIYDKEKYGGSIDTFYNNNRAKFFDTYGLSQLVRSIKQLDDTIPEIDKKFPKGKSIRIFPIIIVNEKGLQTPLMGKIFQDRFIELLGELKSKKVHIYPLSVIHVSDLEIIQDFLNENPNQIWDLLRYHCRNPHFMPPFYNSIIRSNIRTNYKRSYTIYTSLIQKFHTEQSKTI